VVAKRGCSWADSVHPGNPRIERLNNDAGEPGDRFGSPTKVVFATHPSA
jgi:hypothetical protein